MLRATPILFLLAACGAVGCDGVDGPKKLEVEDATADPLSASDHTPGYFREVFRLLEAQADLDATDAASLLSAELASRNEAVGELPDLSVAASGTLDGLLTLGLAATRQTEPTPTIARKIGRSIFETTLGLDPALTSFNANGGDAAITTPGAATLAAAALAAVNSAADDAAVICASTQLASEASFDPGEPEVVWVEGACQEDEWVDGYCEPDEWIDGECYAEWIAESCSGGEWVDEGYYDYYCWDEYDCDYVWREAWVYYDGDCTGGYWDEWCDSGRWEPGLCYDGYRIDGECEAGHYEYLYPDGAWDFSALSVPEECDAVRPQQFVIAITGARVLADVAYRDLSAEWRSALDALLLAASPEAPDEGIYAAALQILAAANDG